MENPRDDLAAVLQRVTARINELESRVSALEHSPSNAYAHALPASSALTESHPLAQLSPVRSPGAIPAIGRLFLGIAGGYVLRYLAESGALPHMAIVVLALAYAAGWLVWAARMPANARFARAIAATTAALIFSPMLWEITLRFKMLEHAASAGVLTGFVVLASALAWKPKLTSVTWVATFFPAVTALMLLVASRDPVPFASALLLMALLTETASLHDRWRSLRPAVALLADSAILILILLYSGPAQTPPDYKPITPVVLLALTSSLFAIYFISIAVSTVARRQRINLFEIGQAVIACVLAVVSLLRVTHDAAAPQIGAFCVLLAGACYFAALTRFDHPLQPRNYHVFATWAAALVIVASILLFRTTVAALWLSVTAIVATYAGIRLDRISLSFHGAVYLGIAGYFSGLWSYAAGALAGSLARLTSWSLWSAVFSVAACCTVVWWMRDWGTQWTQRVLRLFLSLAATYTGTALAVVGLVGMIAAESGTMLAVIRTLVLCLVILVLSFSGSKWNHAELLWIAYATLFFCTLKLLFEDLRYGTAGSLATSLFLYGTIWILVPRLVRSGRAA